jgi:hypothetical protein
MSTFIDLASAANDGAESFDGAATRFDKGKMVPKKCLQRRQSRRDGISNQAPLNHSALPFKFMLHYKTLASLGFYAKAIFTCVMNSLNSLKNS